MLNTPTSAVFWATTCGAVPAPAAGVLPAFVRREPGIDERHSDGERGAADTEEESADQQGGEGPLRGSGCLVRSAQGLSG
ncbi:hypothetical protein [Streptomyces sp. 11x1]|uniref:hypothetical protein n=1 Tax=Streptomyces sp. 11x1 TaxID=3038642 RepID=UPI00292E2842|nr:hypothetical protein [Streptomyces sp. 11x1]WNZ13175.1 hypothetical protein P8T65_40170 [Streptomyces sp. 11x1]